jgi:hypothetical protein
MDDTVDYCRQIETYLCQKNGGHLVRIVGPAFEKVRQWSAQGIPLKIAFRGIDRTCERANARGGRRRPMRIEFCVADVLSAFDDWRRAIGIGGRQVAEASGGGASFDAGAEPEVGPDASASRKGPLAMHIQRCVARLLAPKGVSPDPEYDALLRRVTGELDTLAMTAKNARGETRAAIIDRLAELDAVLIDAARTRIDSRTAAALQVEADGELAGFADRMPAGSLERARGLAFARLLREALNLPVLSYD